MDGRIGKLSTGAGRLVRRGGRKRRSLGNDSSRPLALLYDVHPEARNASPREVGLVIVPVEAIRGSAVEPVQRGRDFRPFRSLRGADWEARYQRILLAMDRLEVLPAVELLRFGDGYWVVDGHNRVAAAKQVGQAAVDAAVTDLQLPGSSAPPAAPIAQYLEESRELRAAGGGRPMRQGGARRAVDPEGLASERRIIHGEGE